MKPVVLPDEKKESIVPIVQLLRKYNPSIGQYERSIFNATHYVVKLSNGRISLQKGLIDSFRLDPTFVSDGQLKDAASAFTPAEASYPEMSYAESAISQESQVYDQTGLIIKYILTAIALIGLLSVAINYHANRQRRDYVVYGR